MRKILICSKKSVRTFKLRIEPYFLSHAERGESLQNQGFLGGMQNRRPFAPTIFLVLKPFSKNCGGGEIRTLETLSSLPPFQGGGINHYPTPPCRIVIAQKLCKKCLNAVLNRRMRRKEPVHELPRLSSERIPNKEVCGCMVGVFHWSCVCVYLLKR